MHIWSGVYFLSGSSDPSRAAIFFPLRVSESHVSMVSVFCVRFCNMIGEKDAFLVSSFEANDDNF